MNAGQILQQLSAKKRRAKANERRKLVKQRVGEGKTPKAIANETGVKLRTIYRDIIAIRKEQLKNEKTD